MGGRHPTRPRSRWPRRRPPGRFARGVVLPPFFGAAIGAAITVWIATTALGIADIGGWAGWLLPAGVAVFVLVAVIEVAWFRRVNGVWPGGFASRVVGGTATAASTSYVLFLTVAGGCGPTGPGRRHTVGGNRPGCWPCWRSSRSPARCCWSGVDARAGREDSAAGAAEIADDADRGVRGGVPTLRETLGVSDSVLSKHEAALAAIGYVNSRKGIHAGRRTTWISLTAAGRTALSAHVAALRDLIAGVE